MRALDKKLYRDLARLWVQVLAISLVLACGVAVLIMSIGASRSLEGTRDAFYERYRFASVFASATRAPRHLAEQIKHVPGVSAFEMRIVQSVVIDVLGMQEPASGIVVSLPDNREPGVNRLYLRKGRLPQSGGSNEVAVVETFANAHGFRPGDQFKVVMNGRKRTLTIVGIVLTPEYIYALGPGDMVPDARRFGVLFMPDKVLSAIYNKEGAFDDIAVTTLRDADTQAVIAALDDVLQPYGGAGGHDRTDQMSNAFLDNELKQLRALASVIPVIFLAIAAFLVNMILSRLIALEREQIGLLKAIGYSNLAIGWHYAMLAIVIAFIGFAIGALAGNWLGRSLTTMYAEFFTFPFLIYERSPDLYFIGAFVATFSAIAGAAKAIWSTVVLPPAVAMRPPAPTRYRRMPHGKQRSARFFSQLTIMAVRHLLRRPLRSAFTALGTAMSVALLISSLFTFDSMDHMIDTIFYRTMRQDASLNFSTDLHTSAGSNVAALSGVLTSEPFRNTVAELRNGHLHKRVGIQGVRGKSDLVQVLDPDEKPMAALSAGLMISERLADTLQLRAGDQVEVKLLQHDNLVARLPIGAVIHSFLGLTAYMDMQALDRLLRNEPRISGVLVSIDENKLDELYQVVKSTPGIASVALTNVSRKQFRDMIERNITISTTIYVIIAVIITFGVIYNSARIQLSERARELASLRVFGFTRKEVSSVLITELGILVLLAQPLGWLLGYGLSWLITRGLDSDLFRIPHIVYPSTYANSSMVVLVAAVFSAVVVISRVARLDLIRVLKTRE